VPPRQSHTHTHTYTQDTAHTQSTQHIPHRHTYIHTHAFLAWKKVLTLHIRYEWGRRVVSATVRWYRLQTVHAAARHDGMCVGLDASSLSPPLSMLAIVLFACCNMPCSCRVALFVLFLYLTCGVLVAGPQGHCFQVIEPRLILGRFGPKAQHRLIWIDLIVEQDQCQK